MGDFEKKMRDFRMQRAQGMGCGQAPPMTLPFSRALGDREFKVPCGVISGEPEIRTIILQREHRALVLLCDGVSDVMSPEDVCGVLQYNVGNEKNAGTELVQEAYKRGSEENLTALTVYLRWPTK